jgi:dTDP-4-dehydrorhamnose 3,5-epimerase
MIFKEQEIKGVYLITPEPYKDDRGMLRRHFCANEFRNKGINFDIKQCNISENHKIYTLRGFHFQKGPYGEDKIISAMAGGIFDVVIDFRENSATYLKTQKFELTAENRLALLVPKGCANAYLTLYDNTWIFYYHSEFYAPGAEVGIRYNDPFFNIKWPATPKVISEKDLLYPDFKPL